MARRLLLVGLTTIGLAAPAVATSSAATTLLGNAAIGASPDYNAAGDVEAFKFTATATGMTSSASVYVDRGSSATTLDLALYRDANGHPGSLIVAGSNLAPKAGSWNLVPVARAAVNSGAPYWIAVLGRGGTLRFRDSAASTACVSETSSQQNLSAFPSIWSFGASWPSCRVSAYVSAAAAAPGVPANTSAPALSGQPAVGTTLSVSTGSWSGSPTGYAYQWQTCDPSGARCANIAGASLAAYTLGTAEVNHTVRAVVTARNPVGSAAASTAASVLVKGAAPLNTAAPVLSGNAVQGQTLSASVGSWAGSPTSFAYLWQRCDAGGASCASIAAATAATYTLTAVDVSHTVRVVVTATNVAGSAAGPSVASALVAAALAAPVATVAPTLSGQATQGQAVVVTNGSWSGSPTSYVYQWQDCDAAGVNCASLVGAITASYTLAAADIGHTVRAVVTAANPAGTASASTTPTAIVASAPSGGGLTLPHDPSFVGPSYYARFAHGPSSSMSYFPIYTYQANLAQWSGLPSRITAMGVKGVDSAYDAGTQATLDAGAANGLTFNIAGSLGAFGANTQAITSYAMQDEPNQDGSVYAASACAPTNDTCAQAYVNDANAQRAADSTRPVWGNFTKDVTDSQYPPAGWSAAQFRNHVSTQINATDIVSADLYGWTDTYEWNQVTGAGTGNFGAWVYGHAISSMNAIAPRIPAYGFVECCDSVDGTGATKPVNSMMPGMIESAIWNILVHGGRGYTFWTTDFWDASAGGDPFDNPYTGATYYAYFAMFADHQWDAQYNRAQEVDRAVLSYAPQLNSPTVSGISTVSSAGVPVSALGKDVNGKLWVLAQADGDSTHPLSNTTAMAATITLPSSVAVGTVLNVAGEGRTVTVDAHHQITDTFGTTTEVGTYNGKSLTYGYQHHVYAMG